VTAHAIRCVGQPDGDARLGLYHLVASGETTWHAYASHVIEWARSRGLPVKVAAEAIEAVPATAYPTPARRPHNSRLDTRRVQAAFGLTLPHWQAGVDRMLTEISGK
jgi:dTDP-4-dehydrorhamnose reductase